MDEEDEEMQKDDLQAKKVIMKAVYTGWLQLLKSKVISLK